MVGMTEGRFETTEKVPFFKQRFVEKLILLKENQ